ncbi:MAG TPA: hypothetical protein VFZ09_27665 [Archangium sp.]|uniref:hypothetical protein n=1 Tax=Archangium sp. TaxID=1872627 RepID=UPI002E2F7862|nr:hypothetical protein [Archangium sp.]HEX5750039.1 hypothetical protein [Archangium sp.]
MAEPRERPILFSGPMVRAILHGRKTQTRRVVKPQPPSMEAVRSLSGDGFSPHLMRDGTWTVAGPVWAVRKLLGTEPRWRCPYGRPGDRLWVRESWGVLGNIREASAEDQFTAHVEYSADLAKRTMTVHMDQWRGSYERRGKWRPSIHMPRWASRITLEVTGVRVERLHDISEADAQAEGVVCENLGLRGDVCRIVTPSQHWKYHFQNLWASINTLESWRANPWVWVVEFRRVEVANP